MRGADASVGTHGTRFERQGARCETCSSSEAHLTSGVSGERSESAARRGWTAEAAIRRGAMEEGVRLSSGLVVAGDEGCGSLRRRE